MKTEETKRLVAKSENSAVEFKRTRGGVPADCYCLVSESGKWISRKRGAEMMYNHPFVDLEPSKGDLDFTRRPAELSEIAQIRLLDHLIVTTTRETSKSYCSIRELHQELFQ